MELTSVSFDVESLSNPVYFILYIYSLIYISVDKIFCQLQIKLLNNM